MNDTRQVDSRIAIVTGAARGIGAAIAQRLAADGLSVAVMDLEKDACMATVEAIQSSNGKAAAFSVNVAQEDSVREAVARVAASLGPPTVLVNNAGTLRESVLAKTTLDDWELMQNVNLRGAFLMSREVTPFQKSARQGRIVNLSSTGALGSPGLAAYSAAKAGVQGFTRTLAIEAGRYGVTVNAVAPGFVVSAMTSAVAQRTGMDFEQMQLQIQKEVPVGRVGQPEDIAHAVAFFVDPRSSYVSGQVLYVAGGPRG